MTDPVFFVPARRFSVREVAALTGAELINPEHGDIGIGTIAPAAQGGSGALVFLSGGGHSVLAANISAAAVLCTADIAEKIPAGVAVLVTPKPQAAFAQIARLLFPGVVARPPVTGETGISPRAFVEPSAKLEAGVIVEAGAVIGAHVSVGAGTLVAPNAIIGHSCQIGRNCYIGPSVSVQFALIGDRVVLEAGARIGQDGFGFVTGQRGPERIPQIGRVILQDDVEIGANTTVDRGAMADTIIGEATKIDNLVQVAHNVRIGRACLIAAHVGISGSVTIGDHVLLGGRAGIADHITIGDGAQVGAASGVMNDIPAGGRWIGAPAVPTRDFFRQIAAVRRLVKAKRDDTHG